MRGSRSVRLGIRLCVSLDGRFGIGSCLKKAAIHRFLRSRLGVDSLSRAATAREGSILRAHLCAIWEQPVERETVGFEGQNPDRDQQ